MYWGVACMDLMDRLSDMDREGIIQFLVECQDSESGGFRPVQNHDRHLLNTLSRFRWQLSLIVWTRSTG